MNNKKYTLFSSFSETDDVKQNRNIKRARFTIISVALLTIGYAIYMWFKINSEIKKAMSNPLLVLDQTAISQVRLLIGLTFIMGVFFLLLYFWSKKKPFEANLAAFLIYVGNFIAAYILHPQTAGKGISIKGLIIFLLINGVLSGWKQKQAQKSIS